MNTFCTHCILSNFVYIFLELFERSKIMVYERCAYIHFLRPFFRNRGFVMFPIVLRFIMLYADVETFRA